jgi:hypothetical protein
MDPSWTTTQVSITHGYYVARAIHQEAMDAGPTVILGQFFILASYRKGCRDCCREHRRTREPVPGVIRLRNGNPES